MLVCQGLLQAQSFEEAVELYEQEQYEESLEMLYELEPEDNIVLFIGKNHTALGEFLKAGYYFDTVTDSEDTRIAGEARFSMAVNEFRLKNLSSSLQILYDLKNQRDRTGIYSQANRFYNDIMRYITESQRNQLFWEIRTPGIRYDLVRSAVGRSEYAQVRAMFKELQKVSEIISDTTEIRTIADAIGTHETYVRSPFRQYRVPEGMVYQIGVALPSFETDEPEFEVSRNLYFGMVLAAEEFNARNPDKKLFLRFKDTHSNPDSAANAVHELVWNYRVDAMIGPLFSESARKMSQLAESYEIPLITPLANSDEINLGHYYTYQLNPTFAVHGKQMAEFAVNERGLDTLAVVTEQHTLGRNSALAFRQKAEELGAHVEYYMEEDFASLGYDITEITDVFTTDSLLADSLGYKPVKGVYAPFTGQASSTLINLFMTDLEAMGSDLVVMGSEDWRDARYTRAQLDNFEIYYTQNRSELHDRERIEFFEVDFQNRFGLQADRFSQIGYDTATFLINAIDQVGNPKDLKHAIREAPPFDGLATRIHFGNTTINQLLHIEPLTDRARERLGIQPGEGEEPEEFIEEDVEENVEMDLID